MKSSPVKIHKWYVEGSLDIEEARRKRDAFLAERKRRNDEEFEQALHARRREYERQRKARQAELYQLKQKQEAADRHRQLAGAVCGLDLSEEALETAGRKDLKFMDYPFLLDNVHTTEAYVERWLKDEGVDISD